MVTSLVVKSLVVTSLVEQLCLLGLDSPDFRSVQH